MELVQNGEISWNTTQNDRPEFVSIHAKSSLPNMLSTQKHSNEAVSSFIDTTCGVSAGTSSAKRPRLVAPEHHIALTDISLDAKVNDEAEPVAITSLLTDDLLPVKPMASNQSSVQHTQAQRSAPKGHIQVSNDLARPTFFVYHQIPSCKVVIETSRIALLR